MFRLAIELNIDFARLQPSNDALTKFLSLFILRLMLHFSVVQLFNFSFLCPPFLLFFVLLVLTQGSDNPSGFKEKRPQKMKNHLRQLPVCLILITSLVLFLLLLQL